MASDRLTEAPGPAHPQALPARGTHSPAAAPQEGCRPLAARLTNGSVEPRRQIRFKIADQPIREHHPHDNACVRARGREQKKNGDEHAHYVREPPKRAILAKGTVRVGALWGVCEGRGCFCGPCRFPAPGSGSLSCNYSNDLLTNCILFLPPCFPGAGK